VNSKPSDATVPRVVCWFSAGAASAVATQLTLAEAHDPTVVAYCDPGSEHPDNARFLDDCERWFGQEIIRLRSEKYADTWQVYKERRFLVGPTGALCSTELKKNVRRKFQRHDDTQVFGFTAEEQARADRFRELNIEVNLSTPLIDRGLTKADCLAIVDRAEIELPAMYRLGYHNANCVGCVHGGMGYWNKIRVDFPDTFDRMAAMEREVGHSLNKDGNGPVWLDELGTQRGDYPTEIQAECSLLCALAESRLA
jgi:3'-phosphoadenosine 5'-phosphosulfate sulfotransferase (PAPS reductase)/FAD synthetase